MERFANRSVRVRPLPLYSGYSAPRASRTLSYDYEPPEPDISRCSPENRFKYVENLIIKLHKETYERDAVYADVGATFDDWKDRVAGIKAEVHKRVADYYTKLNFIERYGLASRSWIHDKDRECVTIKKA